MEKKTIGQFIATLRKANGMTQRQLADKLNVSDKAISRWERDESAPDLTLIPVIAEIFGVTSDEILRGERKNVEAEESPRAAEKTEKQMEHLITLVKFKLSVRGIISIGIAIFGLIAAMICNFGFNRASLGFLIACVFYIGAAICEVCFGMKAFYAINNSEFDGVLVSKTKKQLATSIEKVLVAIVGFLAFTLPLVFWAWDMPYCGILAITWFVYGVVGVVAILIIYLVISYPISKWKTKKCGLTEEPEAKDGKLYRLRMKCFGLVVVLVVITAMCQSMFNSSVWVTDFVAGQTFYDLDQFIDYMETDSTDFSEYNDGTSFTIVQGEDGQAEEVSQKEKLYGPDGETVIAEYVNRNETVSSMRFKWNEDGQFKSVTVYSRAEAAKGMTILENTNYFGFGAVYIIEILAVALLYNRKRKNV